MILRDVEGSWFFIHQPDDNGNYRVTFKVTQEQDKEIQKALENVAEDNKVKLSQCDWQGSRKEVDGVITYSAKCSSVIKNRHGVEREIKLAVYDISAKLYDEVPSPIANGAIINVSVEPYFASFKNKKGVMLGLRGIQLKIFELYTGVNNFIDETNKDGNANNFSNETNKDGNANKDSIF